MHITMHKTALNNGSSKPSLGKVCGAAALIAGAMVGAGLLAMPARTFNAGMGPSTTCLTFMAIYLAATGVLLVECAYRNSSGPGANILSLVENTLGPVGRKISWVLYLLIYAPTITAYIAEGGIILTRACSMAAGKPTDYFRPEPFEIAFAVTFAGLILGGAELVDKMNRIAVLLALSAFAAVALPAATQVTGSKLGRADWSYVPESAGVLVVAMSFHNTVPSVAKYLGDFRAATQAVVLGVAVPYVMYVVWEGLILGAVGPADRAGDDSPLTTEKIMEMLAKEDGEIVALAVEAFSFLAIVTSILGVGLGMVDFLDEGLFGEASRNDPVDLHDGVHTPSDAQQPDVEKHRNTPCMCIGHAVPHQQRRRVAVAIAFVPALIIALVMPSIFIPALEFSVTSRLVLFGIFPTAMVWKMRQSPIAIVTATNEMRGGTPALAAIGGTTVVLLCHEVYVRVTSLLS